MNDLLHMSIALLFIGVLLYKAVQVVPENKRMVLFRLGKFLYLQRAGLHIVVPFVDVPVVVNLSDHLPNWQSMTPDEVDKMVKQMVMNDPDPKKFK